MKKCLTFILTASCICCITGCGNGCKNQVLSCESSMDGFDQTYEFTYDKEGKVMEKAIATLSMKAPEDMDIEEVKKEMEESCNWEDGEEYLECKVTTKGNKVIMEMTLNLDSLDEDVPFTKNTTITELQKNYQADNISCKIIK